MKPKEKPTTPEKSRRAFLTSAAALGSMSFIPYDLKDVFEHSDKPVQNVATMEAKNGTSIIGEYGPWATEIVKDPPLLSFRNPQWSKLDSWRPAALAKAQELFAAPSKSQEAPEVIVKSKYEYDGLTIEELQWQLPYGRPTQAILLKPAGAIGPLPAVLGLHDHGGQKYFGKRKITKTSDDPHPVMAEHQQTYYSGMAWANELAKQGYVVLVHDTFTFASRRVWYEDISSITWGACDVTGKSDENPEDPENIKAYNLWAGEHEHIMAKSLFCSGTTWPGLTLMEDQTALDILCARTDVEADNVGCCGLSGGGLRSNYLGGLDARIKCAISVGFMSTWRDFIMNKSYTHTWMTYAALLPKYLEFPEILGLRVPLPTMVMNNNEDELYTLSEMKEADKILQEVFAKAGASDKYSGKFYPGTHKFEADMQKDAFEWFDRWLK